MAAPAAATAPPPPALRAWLALLGCTAIWGAAYPVLRVAVDSLTPQATVLLRFALATLAVLPLAVRHLRHGAAARAGVVLGVLNFAIFTELTAAIGAMPPARTAFLMGTSVVMVPLLHAAVARQRPAAVEAAAALGGLLGVALMTGARPDRLDAADRQVLVASALTAVGIVVLQQLAARRPLPPPAVVFYLMLTVTVLALPAAWRTPWPLLRPSGAGLAALAYGALLANVAAHLVQVRYQPQVRSSVAALLYTLKPLFAALVAWPLFGEPLSAGLWRGGLVIVLASLLQPALRARQGRRRGAAG